MLYFTRVNGGFDLFVRYTVWVYFIYLHGIISIVKVNSEHRKQKRAGDA